MHQPGPAPGHEAPRLVWADVAKGSCIVLVVLHHAVSKHYVDALPSMGEGLGAAWMTLTYGLKPIRMPLFFLISGLFAARALQRPWRAVWPTRLANVYFLYALWLCIHAVLFAHLRQLPMNRTRSGAELALDLIYASTGLWYLYALVAYFAVARLLRPVSPQVVVLVAGGLALATPWLGIAAFNRASVLQHFVYFAVGAFFPAAVERMARLRPTHALGLTVLAVLIHLTASTLDVRAGTATVLVSITAVPVAVWLAAVIARWSPAARPLAGVGRRTLSLYVLHVPVLAVWHLVLPSPLPFESSVPGMAALAVYPVLGTAVVIACCLVLQRVLEGVGAGWMFRGPHERPRPATPSPARAPRLHAVRVAGGASSTGERSP